MPRSSLIASSDSLESRRLMSAVSFAVDSAASELTISVTANVSHGGSFTLKPQADGLDSAALSGTVVADFSTKGVRFNGGSTIDVIDHAGSFSPGSKAAAYAVKGQVKKLGIKLATATAAIRGLSFDLTHSSRKKPANNGRLLLRNGEAAILDGSADYKLDSRFGDGDGSKSLDDLSSAIENGFAKLTGASGSRTITVPINIVYTRKFSSDFRGTFRLKGQIVAHENASRSPLAFIATESHVATKHRAPSAVADVLS